MTLRLTLPKKYQSGPAKDVVKLMVDHYNKKHADCPLDAAALHLKVAGGNHLDDDAKVEDYVATGDELYVLGATSKTDFLPPVRTAPSAPAAAPTPPKVTKQPAKDASEPKAPRCKRFGCNKFFDPSKPEECVHHKAPPIFHETAKWWSCCPNTKAYDWEEFMGIPGCQRSECHSTTPDGQDGKRFLGGHDLRGDTAPQRLDADAPPDPRHKLDDLRRGLVAIGVDGQMFEKVWAKLAAQTGGDIDQVCGIFRSRLSSVLDSA